VSTLAIPGSAVHVEGLSLDFPLYHGSARSLKKTVMAAASNRLGSDNGRGTVVQALRDISFSLNPGDRLGLVGSNGAGKSTLLRALAGIYEPVRGRVRVEGTMNALLDTNLGMNMLLTGRENITLRGLYAGMSAREIETLAADVEQFAALGEFMELPVRFYSSGMVIRLGFGLATAIRPQVLLMDEWFMAGDATFQEKAHARLESVVRGAEILVITSHLPGIIRDWCTRVLWLDGGRIRADGAPAEVLDAYLNPDSSAAARVSAAATAG
jgi:lipopolysaccharide transport system ATP-binding protein